MTSNAPFSRLAAQRMPRSDKLAMLEAVRRLYDADVARLCQRLHAGEISVDTWSEAMQAQVKDVHIGAYLAGHSGDWSAMTQNDWGRLGNTLRGQYRYLRTWAMGLKEGDVLNETSLAQLAARADLYSAAASQSFEQGYSSEIGLSPSVYPAWPGDGTTNCRTRCRCRWSVRIVSKERGDYYISWKLGGAEHCVTCRRRARSWKNLEVRGGRLVDGYEPIYSSS